MTARAPDAATTGPEERTGGPPATLFIIAGEESGDQLGARLMESIGALEGDNVRFLGVGGARMQALGLESLFPMERISLHGFTAILPRLPDLIRRIRSPAATVAAEHPDAVVLIDVPAFNLRVGKAVRRRAPDIPIIDYVSPTVWAYAPWRARSMARYVDLLLAILPFEPDVHQRLGGPRCEYVGHPLIEMVDQLRPAPGERAEPGAGIVPKVLVLPGSRRSEIRRLLQPFGEALAIMAAEAGPLEAVLPAAPRLVDELRSGIADWPVKPAIIEGEAAKWAAFRSAHAALAASGTVSLELALAQVPTVIAYKVDPVVRMLKRFMTAPSIVLANLVLERNVIPEFLDGEATPQRLAAEMLPLLTPSPARREQMEAFGELDQRMALASGTPSGRAADLVLQILAADKAGGVS